MWHYATPCYGGFYKKVKWKWSRQSSQTVLT
jgi:hypothetical protein